MPVNGPANATGYSIVGANDYVSLVPYDALGNCSALAFVATSCTVSTFDLDEFGNAIPPGPNTVYGTLSFNKSSGYVTLSSQCMLNPLVMWASPACVAASNPADREVDVYGALAVLACHINLGACHPSEPPDTPLSAFNVSTVAAFASGLSTSACGACMRNILLSEAEIAVDTGGAVIHVGVRNAGTTMRGQSVLMIAGRVLPKDAYWYPATSHLVVDVPEWGTAAERRLQVRSTCCFVTRCACACLWSNSGRFTQVHVGAFFSNTILLVAAAPAISGFVDFSQVRDLCSALAPCGCSLSPDAQCSALTVDAYMELECNLRPWMQRDRLGATACCCAAAGGHAGLHVGDDRRALLRWRASAGPRTDDREHRWREVHPNPVHYAHSIVLLLEGPLRRSDRERQRQTLPERIV